MAGINTGRWFISGIIAGVIIAVVDFVLNVMILAQRWNDAMTALNLPPPMSGSSAVFFIIIDLIIGLAALWIYVGIRPRFGATATTAVYAGIATWLLSVLLPNILLMALGLFPSGLLWIGIVVGLVQYVVATVVGAYFYQEEGAA